MAPENSGSKFPKISLGALRDDVELTPPEFESLQRLCRQTSAEHFGGSDCSIDCGVLTVASMRCRSLERLSGRVDIPLAPRLSTVEAVPAAQYDKVNEVVAEVDDDGPTYFARRIEGRKRSRESHYRSEHTEDTLVVFTTATGRLLRRCIDCFRCKVDELLPNYYCWFRGDALHCTIRALDLNNKNNAVRH